MTAVDKGEAAAAGLVTVRRAGLADMPAAAWLFDAYRMFYEQASDPDLAERFLRTRFERHESVLLLAEAPTGGLIGLCQLYPSFCSVMAAPILVLYDLFVSPAARRSGTGRALLQAAQAHALQAGAARLDLTTAHDNHRAQALYESAGWVHDTVFRTYTKTIQIPGAALP
jgi:ribosomal protein S18 acetylase RimI-like enzyme